MYRTDIRTIIQMFEQQSIELRALSIQIPGATSQCNASVVLVNGRISSCSIQDEYNRGLWGEEALRFIENLGELPWEYTSLSSSAGHEKQFYGFLGQFTEFAPTTVPIALHKVTTQELKELPREERLVIIVVDGRKTVAEIAKLLSKQYEIVRDALRNLQKRGMIASPTDPSLNKG